MDKTSSLANAYAIEQAIGSLKRCWPFEYNRPNSDLARLVESLNYRVRLLRLGD